MHENFPYIAECMSAIDIGQLVFDHIPRYDEPHPIVFNEDIKVRGPVYEEDDDLHHYYLQD